MSPRIDISIDELPEASSLLDGHDYSSQIIQRIAGVPVILDASGCPHSPFFEVEYDDRTIRFTSRHDNEHIVELGRKLDYVHHNCSGFLKTFFLRIDVIDGHCYSLSNHAKSLSIAFRTGGRVGPFLHLLSSHYFCVNDFSVTQIGRQEVKLSSAACTQTMTIKRIENRWIDVLCFLLGRTMASCNTNMPLLIERYCKSARLHHGLSGIEAVIVFSNKHSPYFADEEGRRNILSLVDTEAIRRLLSPKLKDPSFDYGVNKSDEQREITAKLSISYDKYYPNKKIVKLIALQLASSGRYHPKLMSSDYFSPQSDWADVHLLLIPNTFNDPIFIYYQLALLTGLGNRMRLQKYLSVLSRYFSGMISRQAFNERAVDIDSLCSSLGISPYLDKPTRKLSTGMKQQVKLAMAIATGCPYLILDEPLNGLDPGKRKTSCDAMRSEVARGRSVLISSHLLDDLADLTNSFYFIEAGTLVEKIESSSQTLKQEYLDTYEVGE